MTFKTKLATAIALAITVAAPLPALALDDAQKKEIGAYIKEYLVENPEILIEVQEALQKKQEEQQQAKAQSAITDNEKTIFTSPYDIALGNPKGDVTIVEFFDYNCGYCKRALSDMDEILKDDKNVRFVLKELPILGPDSLAAHKVSAAFRDLAPEKYGEFHRALLGAEGRATEESAIAVASGLGVSEADIRKTMTEKPHDDAVREAYSLANDLGITGTPSYVLGQEMVFGAVGADDLREKIANVRSCGKATC
ncbi:DsbA family protein [Shinella sp. PSBB067]|uniref:DsbA family protein n=1 Tax=Shinella sp. PSBB067 TaxID=2715959 RepID=UPI000927CD3C|nr:DsbA family protein [Shinella sp. PSBB067]OJU83654.1 MAG: disulfide bond formation protein DsbA [Shinella sp. 65-6]QRI64799.1 DsbA family protein [Shinella sp. PSBB067]